MSYYKQSQKLHAGDNNEGSIKVLYTYLMAGVASTQLYLAIDFPLVCWKIYSQSVHAANAAGWQNKQKWSNI